LLESKTLFIFEYIKFKSLLSFVRVDIEDKEYIFDISVIKDNESFLSNFRGF
jgi:hypothetical protein